MKRASLNISIWALVLLASAACNGLEEPGLPQQGAGDYSFGLSVFCNGLQTKADKAGVDGYNENTLDYVDWFVFKSDTDTDDALVSGRGIPAGTDNTVATVCLDEWVPTLGRSYYVYTVANLPSTVAADHDALPTTLSGLKALSHTASFNHQDVFSVEGVQSSFIMRGGEDITFTDGNRGTVVPVSVPLERLAGKVSVRLNVAPAIDERETMPDGSMRYIQTWYPDVDNIEVYLSFANSTSTLEGTPVEYDMSKFFTYYRSGFEASIPATAPSWDNDQWEITGSPFYSYPMTWESESPQAPFLKVILKWKAYDESQGGTVNPVTETSDDGPRFVRHQRNQPAGFLKTDSDLPEFYYKIPLVPMSETGGTLNANDWLEINADLSILGSTSDDLPVIVGGQYYVTDWGTGVEASGDLKQASYLSLDRYTYEFYAQNEITIPVLSSHDLDGYSVISATYTDYLDLTPVTRTLATLNTTTNQLEAPDGVVFNDNQSFVLRHQLNNDYTSSDLECSRITYVLTVSNKAGMTSQPITIIQYPSIYIECETTTASDSYVFVNNNSNRFTLADYTGTFHSNLRPIYDDGDEDYSFSPTLTSSNVYEDSRGVSIVFDVNVSEASKNMNKNSENLPFGSITMTAPAPYWIYKVEFTYTINMAETSTDVTYETDVRTISTKGQNKKWYGEARTLKAQYNYNGYTVTGITVYYHNANYLGNISHNTDTYNANQNGNLYTITATDVSQLSFFIADTRSAVPVNYPQLKGGGSTMLSNYYPLNNIPYNDNAIAPKFIVASTFGGSYGGTMRFESAVERCAAYQENGYPAGRWRLPTDAEIKFIVNLSAKGKIPTLFSGRYWGSSGTDGASIRVNPPGYHQLDGTPQAVAPDETEVYEETVNAASVRCVYPVWYWGDDHSTYKTTWSGWQNN